MIKDLFRNKPSAQTVFTLNEIAALSSQIADSALVGQVHYYVKKGELIRLTKGIYALDQNFSVQELGNKLRTPSYVSLYTVMQEAGLIFQPYTSIFLASNRSEEITIGSQHFTFRKIKPSILFHQLGIETTKGYTQANVERAVADKVYLDGPFPIDNPRPLNLDFMTQLNLEVYKSRGIKAFIDTLKR